MTEYLSRMRALVEAHLDAVLQPAPGLPETLREAMRYSLLGGGKRLRPVLTILACEAAGGAAETALPAASAVEMVHTYSLIHDDLPAMDNDDLRRGQPTSHKKFSEAMAILAGDGLLTLAFEVIADRYPPATASACCRELARGAGMSGMVGGQVADLAWEQKGGTLPDLESLHARKTGALFLASLRMGVYAAQCEWPGGAAQDLLVAIDGFGRCFGLAFQITDDLVDVQSVAEKAGKGTQKDAARGKLTFPGFLGVAESEARARQLCDEAQQHVRPLGEAGERLAALARSLLGRDR
jgi:geranylgeranyl diphosphate synthase type II